MVRTTIIREDERHRLLRVDCASGCCQNFELAVFPSGDNWYRAIARFHLQPTGEEFGLEDISTLPDEATMSLYAYPDKESVPGEQQESLDIPLRDVRREMTARINTYLEKWERAELAKDVERNVRVKANCDAVHAAVAAWRTSGISLEQIERKLGSRFRLYMGPIDQNERFEPQALAEFLTAVLDACGLPTDWRPEGGEVTFPS